MTLFKYFMIAPSMISIKNQLANWLTSLSLAYNPTVAPSLKGRSKKIVCDIS